MSKLDRFEEDYGSKWDVLMEIKLAEYQKKPSGGAGTDANDHLEQFRDSLQLDIDSDNEENYSAVSKPVSPLANDNDVDDGEAGGV